LVLLGMLAVLFGVYTAYASQDRERTRAFAYVLVGASLAGFGIAAGSPLAAAGAIWLMLSGLLWLAGRGWRWAGVAALLAVLPGLWMVSQAALDTGYGVVAALLLPAFVLLAWLLTSYAPARDRASHRVGAIPFALAIIAAAMPQLVMETLVRPAVRAMAGGVGALTGLSVDWGVGTLVRTAQGTVPAALPATGIALAVFLAAIALYWLKQLAGRIARRAGGDAQAE
jgi:MFS family permease